MEQADTPAEFILGVDTHLDVHVGVVIDAVGGVKGTLSIKTNPSGYEKLLIWARSFGRLDRAGIEGTGSYGAGLTRFLEEEGIAINRPNCSRRRLRGKSDPSDAESAARSVLTNDATGVPKARSGMDEALRTLSVERCGAVKAKTQAVNQLRALLISAPSDLRELVPKVKTEHCVAACAALQEDGENNAVIASLKTALGLLARRWNALHEELRELDKQLARLTKLAAPRILGRFGVGPQTAATLLIAASDNPAGCATRPLLRPCAASVPLRPHLERQTVAGSIAVGKDRRTTPCGPSRRSECEAMRGPCKTLPGAPARACRRRRSTAA